MNYEEKTYTIIAEQLGKKVGEIKNNLERTLRDLGADSLDEIEIAIKLEEEYGIKTEDNDLTENTTIRSIITYLQTKLEKIEVG